VTGPETGSIGRVPFTGKDQGLVKERIVLVRELWTQAFLGSDPGSPTGWEYVFGLVACPRRAPVLMCKTGYTVYGIYPHDL
jgi:hypothetical protein